METLAVIISSYGRGRFCGGLDLEKSKKITIPAQSLDQFHWNLAQRCISMLCISL